MRRIDLTGEEFGYIKVLNITNKRTKQKKIIWHCLCTNCNSEFDTSGDNLKYHKITHCGCLGRKDKGHGKNSKLSEYELHDGYYIGYTTNTHNQFFIDIDDYDKVSKYSWYENEAGYAISRIDYKLVRMHRLIMNPPDNYVIDHKNHNCLDNRKCNLRICTHQQNSMNKMAKGYGFYRGKYTAYITKNHKRKYLGNYETIEEAQNARKIAEDKYFREYSYRNSQMEDNREYD